MGGRDDDRNEDERLVPDERRREVVEEAVRDERVLACVPEVVPDVDALADEQRSVEVRRRVTGRGNRRDEHGRPHARQKRGKQDVAPGGAQGARGQHVHAGR